jgi:hypothetical protein
MSKRRNTGGWKRGLRADGPEMFTNTVPTVFRKQQARCKCGRQLSWPALQSHPGPFLTIPFSVKLAQKTDLR